MYELISDNVTTQFTLSYTIEDIFVSKSCGFKSIFNNVSLNIDIQGWSLDNNLTTTTIDNQNQAHVQIFH